MSEAPDPRSKGRSRRFLFAALYFSEGAPIGYIWWALPTKLRAAGVPIERITQLTALLILPWALKFLWAPVIDSLPFPRLTRHSGMDHCGAVVHGFVASSVVVPWSRGALRLVFIAAVRARAVCGDTRCRRRFIRDLGDPVRTPWRDQCLDASRHACGPAVFGGLGLYVERWIGSQAILAAMLACVWASMLLICFADEPCPCVVATVGADSMRIQGFGNILKQALKRRATWLGLALAAFGGSAYEALGSVAGPMLIDHGAGQDAVGLFFAAPAVICMALGAMAGGRIGDQFGRTAAVVGFLLGIALLTISTAIVLAFVSSYHPLFAALGVLYVLIGGFTASSYALFMDLTDPRLGATQFSAFMGATNLCEAWSSLAVGWLIVLVDYPWALCSMVLPTILAATLVPQINRQFVADDEDEADGGPAV